MVIVTYILVEFFGLNHICYYAAHAQHMALTGHFSKSKSAGQIN